MRTKVQNTSACLLRAARVVSYTTLRPVEVSIFLPYLIFILAVVGNPHRQIKKSNIKCYGPDVLGSDNRLFFVTLPL